MIATTTDPLPGIYPFITHRDPSLTGNGCDNLGMGFTEHGEQFMLKDGGALGVAEFVGARVADACGVPACQPTVVTIETWNGPRHVFGSRIESGRHMFDQSDVDSWQKVMAQCNNATAFSAMLAIDLVLGNDDRHWNNWIVQKATDASGKPCLRLRALDFSRSWPVRHPAQHPLRHAGPNTWATTQDWAMLGVSFDLAVFHATCAKISCLNAKWLRGAVMGPIKGVFLSSSKVDAYCAWWEQCLRSQIVEAVQAMEYGVRP